MNDQQCLWRQSMQLALGVLVAAGAALAQPPAADPPPAPAPTSATALKVDVIAVTNHPFATPGDTVQVQVSLRNDSDQPREFTRITLTAEGEGDYRHQLYISDHPVRAAAGRTVQIGGRLPWQTPDTLPEGAYFLTARMTDPQGIETRRDAGFIRLLNTPLPPPTYTIERERYRGLDVFKLRGGMSAEYAVQKALANLAAGVSHSWYTQSPGRGPDRVHASPDFLAQSVRRTVDDYDRYLGADRVYETVILSTGVASVPYLSRVTKAPVLPLHFLVSAGSVREVQAVLNRSAHRGISSYAVLGYDASMPDLGVAWIKLLDLPDAYRDFLVRHKTRRVLIVGTTGVFGETLARRVLPRDRDADSGDEIKAGDVELLYTSASGLPFPAGMTAADVFSSPAFAGDLRQLERRIADLHQIPLQEGFTRIVDWESGVSQQQLHGLANDLQSMGISATLLTVEPQPNEVLFLYDLATHLMQAFYTKNREVLLSGAAEGQLVRGVAINPYLISQPFYESRLGYLPFLFWQGTPADAVTDRIQRLIAACLTADPAGQSLASLHYWFNVTNNFNFFLYPAQTVADQLRANIAGDLSIEMGASGADEVWNLSDGFNASCELVARDLLQYGSAAQLKRWDASLTSLTMKDLTQLQKRFPQMVLRDLIAPTHHE